MADVWFSPSSIRFTWEQVIWLLGFLSMLKRGDYPPEPVESGYFDTPIGKKTVPHRAHFETPVLIAVEIEERLALTGQDGEMVRAFYCKGLREDEIARLVNCDELDVWRRINRALRYIKGSRRKRRSYQEFCQHKGRKYEVLLSG